MVELVKELLDGLWPGFSREQLIFLLLTFGAIHTIWLHKQQRKIRKRQYELIEKVTVIKNEVESRFNGAVKDLRTDLQTSLSKIGADIGKVLDKHEGTLGSIDTAVTQVALKSGTTDTKHDGQIKALGDRVKRIENQQDRR